MKVTGIIFIILGILAIAFNLLMIPEMTFSNTGDDAYDTGYNIGLFLIAIVGLVLFIIGIVLYRAGSRKEKARIAQMYHQQQQQYQQYQQPPQPPQPPQKFNTY